MNLTRKKLEQLWKKKISKEDIKNQRVVQILDSLKFIDKYQPITIPHTEGFFGPAIDNITKGKDDGGGLGSINAMKTKFNNKQDKFIDAVCKIINAPHRDKYFRVFSNSGENSDFESSTTTVGINTPDNYFISNNYFYNIINFIKKSNQINTFSELVGEGKIPLVLGWNDNHSDKDIENQIKILKKRFVTKYLWMLGNKEDVLVVYSLQSFWSIRDSGLFEDFGYSISDLEDDVDFDTFTENWREFSSKLFTDLEIKKEEDKLKFSMWLFTISLDNKMDIKNILDLLTTGNRAVILWGPPGTGKTYESMEVVKDLLDIDKKLDDKTIEDKYLFSKGDTSRNDTGFYDIVQFHPNYTYQDFIGGISPDYNKEKEEVSYFLREGKFKKFCDTASNNPKKYFIFIIDEINRAELSAVFGELLFALEYRGKSIDIPYFGNFTIPKNVYIIGTMNNVDKSLVTFDLALRRRFGFFKLMPKLAVINNVLSETVEQESLEKYFNKCKNLNENIKTKLDLGADYQIGQAYFLKIRDFLNQEKIKNNELQIITSFELEKLWIYNIEPLLEEYLGMIVEEEGIESKLKELKDNFIEDK